MMNEEKDSFLLKILKKKEGYYKAILELAEEEHSKLERRRPIPEIVSLMKKKQILLSCIEECDEEILPLKEEWGKSKKAQAPFAKEIQEELGVLDLLIREILGLDDINRKLFEEILCSLSSAQDVK
ncbi:Uncharacterized protein AB751O23_BK_00030 [Chlamydiales bacterium SCGC AB-751-O23]|jgi:flagellar biosynthesis/type III secretory pathway chaperone|nr:Uncharacterized protein AB751O23_BK_00030 [Chlamydiales bacterium SCGC AB-751-O23]